MIIREATIFDHTGILNCLIEWFDEASVDYPKPNKEMGNWINHILMEGYCVVAEENGIIVGTSGLGYTKFPWNDQAWLLNSEWFHVTKQFRRGGTAKKIIDMVKAYAEERNIPIIMGISSGVDTVKKQRFLQMTGASFVGGNFIYGLGEK